MRSKRFVHQRTNFIKSWIYIVFSISTISISSGTIKLRKWNSYFSLFLCEALDFLLALKGFLESFQTLKMCKTKNNIQWFLLPPNLYVQMNLFVRVYKYDIINTFLRNTFLDPFQATFSLSLPPENINRCFQELEKGSIDLTWHFKWV